MRGIITSRICRSPASKTSSTMRRSSSPSVSWVLTRSRSSSSLICSRFGAGVAAHQPHHQVGRHRQQPDHRTGDPRDPVDGGAEREGEALGTLQREALRGELAEHEGDVGDRDRDEHQRDRRRPRPSGRPEVDQVRRQVAGERDAAERRGEEAGQRDADLHGGEEPVGVLGEPRDRRTATAAARRARGPGSRAATRARSRPRRTCCPTRMKTRISPMLPSVLLIHAVTGLWPSSMATTIRVGRAAEDSEGCDA